MKMIQNGTCHSANNFDLLFCGRSAISWFKMRTGGTNQLERQPSLLRTLISHKLLSTRLGETWRFVFDVCLGL